MEHDWPAVECRPPDRPRALPLARRQSTRPAAGGSVTNQMLRRVSTASPVASPQHTKESYNRWCQKIHSKSNKWNLDLYVAVAVCRSTWLCLPLLWTLSYIDASSFNSSSRITSVWNSLAAREKFDGCDVPNNGRILKYAPECFEVLLCRSFYHKRTAQ